MKKSFNKVKKPRKKAKAIGLSKDRRLSNQMHVFMQEFYEKYPYTTLQLARE